MFSKYYGSTNTEILYVHYLMKSMFNNYHAQPGASDIKIHQQIGESSKVIHVNKNPTTPKMQDSDVAS